MSLSSWLLQSSLQASKTISLTTASLEFSSGFRPLSMFMNSPSNRANRTRSLIFPCLIPSPFFTSKPPSGKRVWAMTCDADATSCKERELRSTIASTSRDVKSSNGVVKNATHQSFITRAGKPSDIMAFLHLDKRLRP